jgi:hypothetical protein
MSINVNGAVSTAYGYTTPDFNEVTQSQNAQAENAAETKATAVPKQDVFTPDLDKVQQMKAESANNMAAFKKMVYTLFKDQGSKFFEQLGGKMEIDEATQLAAQQAIAEDGEWGVEAVANRLLEFAKSLSGGDPSKIEMLRDAVKAGFGAAAKVWGGDLPGISQQTFTRTMELFDEWAREFEYL